MVWEGGKQHLVYPLVTLSFYPVCTRVCVRVGFCVFSRETLTSFSLRLLMSRKHAVHVHKLCEYVWVIFHLCKNQPVSSKRVLACVGFSLAWFAL